MDSDDSLHRLEGSKSIKGGLVVKKKPPTFKVPQPSILGLDKLAAQKRKEREEAARKISFRTDEDNDQEALELSQANREQERKFRLPQEETPTYTGGLSNEARERFIERLNTSKNKEKGVYATTKSDKAIKNYETSRTKNREKDQEKYNDRKRERNKYEDSDRDQRHHRKRENDSSRYNKTPRFRDEPKTPNLYIKDSTSKTSWDEDDPAPLRKSAWDYPTPVTYKSRGDWSERSNWSSYGKSELKNRDKNKLDDTPLPTPSHKFNAWVKDRKKTGATPGLGRHHDEVLKWDTTVDRENWEEEQKRIDREWYNMDEGYDDENNPFASVSDEYTKKKEEQLEQRKKKRLSAQQRQINKDNELWERNRMLTSGEFCLMTFMNECLLYLTTFYRCGPLC